MRKLLDNRGQISILLIWISSNLTSQINLFMIQDLNSMIRQPYSMEAIPIICSSIANGVLVHLKKSKKSINNRFRQYHLGWDNW